MISIIIIYLLIFIIILILQYYCPLAFITYNIINIVGR
jgi:hypothetical protein